MEHFKSRNNDFFHFTNPQDDLSEREDNDSDEQKYYEVDDDRSCDFNFHTFRPLGITQFQPPNFQKSSMMKSNDLTNSMEELGTFDNGALVFEIDHTMKNLSEKLQCAIEGIGTRLSRLENETCKLDKDLEDVKNSAESYHGAAHRKLRQIESVILEVQDSVHFIRDKHEIAETHLQLARLQDLKRDQTDLQQQLPMPASQPSCHIPFPQHVNQSPSNEASFSQAISYHPPERHPFLSHHSQETPSLPSYGCSSIGQLIPSQELDKGLPQQRHVESSRNYKSEFYAKYMPEAASYETSNLKPVRLSQHPPLTSTRSHYTQLPHAVPIASNAENGSNSVDNGGKISADDIVEKVKVYVKELTENGSLVDLNVVLDKMMNSR